MSGRKKDSRVSQGKKPLSHGWIVLPSKTYPDRVYFYNTVTKCSTWNNPCEGENDEGSNYSSSETSSSEVNYSIKTKPKSLRVTHSKKHSSAIILPHLDKNFNNKINHEIEDYDDQDKYFDNKVPRNLHSLSHSHIISPPSSPESEVSTITNITDFEKHDNTLLENNKNQLWVHFVSSPEKPNWKKSVALSDLQEPSTSQNLEIEKTNESEGNKLIFTKENGFFDTATFDRLKSSEKKKNHCEKSKVLSKKMESSVFKTRDKTPAQTRLLKLRKENAEKLKKLTTNYICEAISSEGNSRNLSANVVESSDLIRKKLKKKKKRKRSPSLSSSVGDEFTNSVEKTPAQTKLLNLKRQNAERVQKLVAKHPELAIPSTGNSVQNPVVFDSGTCSRSVPENGNNSFEDYTEEMDWEPSCEEWDVRDINEFRQQLVKASEISYNIFFNSDPSFTLPIKTHRLYLVPDTNIFVSCLSFVKELRDTKVPDLGYPVIYVPWRVLQELDHLKDSKIRTTSKNLKGNVRKAISYLNDNFKSRHPRIFGQSFEDFVKMVDFESYAPDDEILQTCMQLHKQHTDIRLVLLTNDKNLESKAIVSNVEVYSKVSFHDKFLKLNSGLPSSVEGALNVSSNAGATVDYCLCEAKSLLRDFLSAVVETEMKIVFEGEWIRLVVKKPPWSLKDALECLLKHWMSVFFLIFSKGTQSDAELLYQRMFNREAAVTKDEVVDIIGICQRLVKSIQKSQKEKRPYLNLIPVTLTKLSELLNALSPNYSQINVGELSSMSSTNPPVHDSFARSQVAQSVLNDVSKVKALFKDIWDSLRNFCCSISDTINAFGANNEVAIQELRLKLGQTLNEVEEFVSTAEKILELNPAELNECHPVIVYFSSFLIHVYPNILPDLKKELPKCMAAFFTNFEGRSLLSSSLGDFKEFVQDLAKASDYFNAQTSC